MTATNIYLMNPRNIMNKKFIIAIGLVAITIGVTQTVNAQSFEPLRHQPNIQEDEMIVCTKDVSNSQYRNQISCIITPIDDLVDKQTADKIYERTQSLDDTFEMGLID